MNWFSLVTTLLLVTQASQPVIVSELPTVSISKDWTDHSLWVFNFLLVVVGSAQAYYVAKTLKSIDRQAAQMVEQTKVQRATMRQWVEFDKWQSEDVWIGEEPGLQITFTLINPTNFLLVLHHAEITFSPRLPERHLLVTSGTPLPPNKPLRVKLFAPVDTTRLGTFRTGTLELAVEAVIVFKSVLEETATQTIDGVLSCNSNESKFESTIELHSTVKQDEQYKA